MLSFLMIYMVGQASESAEDNLLTIEISRNESKHFDERQGKQKTSDKPLELCYWYGQLEENKRYLYEEILSVLLNFQQDVLISTNDEKEIAEIFECVMNDHPELFYVDAYVYTKYTAGDRVTRITFSGEYNRTEEEAERDKERIDRVVKQCLAGVSKDADEYGQVKYFYEYIIHHTRYSEDEPDSQNMSSVFLNGKSVCKGYACALQYLCDQVGIVGSIVAGEVSNGLHAWNLIRIDGCYYHVDVTWGDANFRSNDRIGRGEPNTVPEIDYDYLCVTTEQISHTHSIKREIAIPECTAVSANYYVREGLYFTCFDRRKLHRIFDNAYENHQKYVTFRCDNESLYELMYQELIGEQKIFDYLSETGQNVSHVENPNMHSICIWL